MVCDGFGLDLVGNDAENASQLGSESTRWFIHNRKNET